MKIAVIGCGRQAAKHVAGLRQCPDVEIVLADKEPALARALGEREGLPWTEGVDQLLADPGVHAVDLCVPTPAHAPLIRQALAAQKDFFCEKPLCQSAAEAEEINGLTARAERVGMVGYVYRHAPVFQAARAILEGAAESGHSPVLGTISLALMRIGGRGSAAVWKHRRAEGGGAINEMLVHMLDLAVWYFGPMARAELLREDLLRPGRLIAGRMEQADAEDFVLARFTTGAGIPIVIQGDLVTPSFTQLIEIQGDNGTLMASIQPEMPQFVYAVRAAGGYPAGRTELTRDNINFFDAQMAAFVAALRERRPDANRTLGDSLHVMRALEALKAAR
jgi:myo-inositol 2-dehydrogenase / D-chiro-inositol 1-dehydrogenase